MKQLADWITEKTTPLVPDAGSIPLEHAAICSNFQGGRDFSDPITDLHVVDFRAANEAGTEDAWLWERAGNTSGACIDGWGVNPRQTPLGMIAEMAFNGGLPKGEDFVRLLQQFAKIEGCDWALHMLAALCMGDMIGQDGEEYRIG